MSWYEINKKTETKKEYVSRIKYDEIICKKAASIRDMIDGELTDGIQYRIITEQGFNAITVIEYLHKYYELTDVYIAVYRMNQKSVNKLIEIIETKNINCVILLSSFFRENKRYEKWCQDLLNYSSKINATKVFFSWSHAKVFISKTKCGKHIVFEGSGNLSDNARIEQYILENNKKTYEFHKKWIINENK